MNRDKKFYLFTLVKNISKIIFEDTRSKYFHRFLHNTT